MIRLPWLLLAAAMLTGCYAHSEVQELYNFDSNACREYAEANIGRYASSGDTRTRNSEMVTLFSDCMYGYGWTVATPAREGADKGAPKAITMPRAR